MARDDEEFADNPCDAARLCRLLAEWAEYADDLVKSGVILYAYGSVDNDPILPGLEHITTVLAHHENRQRWFQVEVTEFDPRTQLPWQRDDRVRMVLTSRARGPHPGFRYY